MRKALRLINWMERWERSAIIYCLWPLRAAWAAEAVDAVRTAGNRHPCAGLLRLRLRVDGCDAKRRAWHGAGGTAA
jgi:hypothetical protein